MFALMATDHLTAAERATPFLGMSFWHAMGFGLGLSIADNPTQQDWPASPGRLGWPGAYGTWWVADPAEDMIALMMIQLYYRRRRHLCGPIAKPRSIAGDRRSSCSRPV